ncbi:MAG: hypothetical protein HN353_05950 [Bdellovibrionales bacterium]|jgi:hypothetical protein|nr:hypothetical protein [Bdellovibrionales bacterium]MBT3527066.1 hypothetical protein [Bdellovibrionales bacterium]MBT7668717.1 hypothetical protein [Bdellovibrionales bacterium]MBT7766470.1 hypothetical protein [Bdellovibrionales bacterium]
MIRKLVGHIRSKAFIALLLVIFSSVTILLSLLIKDKLSPETIRAQAQQKLKQLMPFAKVIIGPISFRPGLRLSYTIDGINIATTIKKRQHDLLQVKRVRVEVPLWSLLARKGQYKVYLVGAKVDIIAKGESNNWIHSMRGNEYSQQNGKLRPSLALTDVPHSLQTSKIDLDARDLEIAYRLPRAGLGTIKLSKLAIKKISLFTPSALEVISDNRITLPNDQIINCQTVIIGDFNLSDMIKNRELKLAGILRWSDFLPVGAKQAVKQINSNFNMAVKGDGRVSGQMKGAIFNSGSFSFDYLWGDEKLSFTKVRSEMPLFSVLNMIAVGWAPKINSQLKLASQGGIDISRDGLLVNIDSSIQPSVSIKHGGVAITSHLAAHIDSNKIKFKISSQLLDGSVESVFSLGWQEFMTGKSKTPVDVKVTASDLVIDSSSKWFFDLKRSLRGRSGGYLVAGSPMGAGIPLNIGFSIGNLLVDQRPLKVAGRLLALENRLHLSPFKVGVNRSLAQGELEVINQNSQKTQEKFNLKFKSFDLAQLKPLLPKRWSDTTGMLTGKIRGYLERSDKLKKSDYQVEADLQISEGSISRIDLGEVAKDHFSSLVTSPPEKDNLKVDAGNSTKGSFSQVDIKLKATPDLIDVKKLSYVDRKKTIKIKGQGQLHPNSTERLGQLDFILRDDEGVLLQDIGRKYTKGRGLPIRLIGFGYDLKPDLRYITMELSKMISQYHKKRK